MTLLFLFYCFLSIIFVLGISYYFSSIHQEATAIIVFIGSLVCVIIYGIKWFSGTGDLKGGVNPGKWPPIINYCPDFMTLTTDSSGKKVCIDTVGVGFNVDNPITKWTDSTQTDDSRYIVDQSGDACAQAKSKGVTWEGIFNGATCNNTSKPPTPP